MALKQALPSLTFTDSTLPILKSMVFTTLVGDDFNRANASTLGSTAVGNQAWQLDGASAAGAIVSNQAKLVPTSAEMTASVDVGVADGTYQITLVDSGSDTTPTFSMRYIDMSNRIYLVRTTSTNARYSLVKILNGAKTTLGTASSKVIAAGDVVQVILNGASYTVNVNGATIITASDSGSLNTKTRMGFGVGATNITSLWDAFTFSANILV